MLMSIHEDRGQAIQRGMIRYLELVFDVSKAASMNDMRPIRSAAMFHAAEEFIRSFFDENPLSQLGIVLMKDGVAKQLTDLSSSPVCDELFFNVCWCIVYYHHMCDAGDAY